MVAGISVVCDQLILLLLLLLLLCQPLTLNGLVCQRTIGDLSIILYIGIVLYLLKLQGFIVFHLLSGGWLFGRGI